MDIENYTPVIIDKWLHVAQDGYAAVNRRYIGRFGMSPKIIVLHIQEGYNWGSWQHFHVVSASSTVLIGRNGAIWRLVPESDGPWTNGDVASPTAIGWEVINKFGPDPNPYSLTIETEGFTGDPAPEAQLQAIVWQIHTWMKTYNIPLRYVIRHADINSVTRPRCPGDALYNEVINRLKSINDVPSEPTYTKPNAVMVNGAPWDGSDDVTVNGAVFHGDIRTVTLNKDKVQFHQYATFESSLTRSTLDEGTEVSVIGWVTGAARDGENRWWITKYFSRLWVGDTTQKPASTDTESPSDTLPAGVKLVDGRVYYPTFEEDGTRRRVVTTSRANLRREPSTDSEVVGIVDKGQELNVRFWTFGDTVRDENIWWLIYNGGDPFKGTRQHLWVAATIERPT